MADTAANKQRFQEVFDRAFNGREVAALAEYVTDDHVDHNPFPGQSPGLKGVEEVFRTLHEAFPDIHVDVHRFIAEDDYVTALSTWSGTHEGSFLGMPATGKRFEVTGIDIVRVVDGKAAEHWGLLDAQAMMEQLGLAPPPAA